MFGGKNIAVPGGANPPDLPGGGRRARRQNGGDASNDCTHPGYSGETHWTCQKDGHHTQPDGTCEGVNEDNKCISFCEVKRTYFVGAEQVPAGEFGEAVSPGTTKDLAPGSETTITTGFSVGLDATAKEAIGAGVSFECE